MLKFEEFNLFSYKYNYFVREGRWLVKWKRSKVNKLLMFRNLLICRFLLHRGADLGRWRLCVHHSFAAPQERRGSPWRPRRTRRPRTGPSALLQTSSTRTVSYRSWPLLFQSQKMASLYFRYHHSPSINEEIVFDLLEWFSYFSVLHIFIYANWNILHKEDLRMNYIKQIFISTIFNIFQFWPNALTMAHWNYPFGEWMAR